MVFRADTGNNREIANFNIVAFMPLKIAKQLPATFNLENVNLLYIANIKFLQCNPNEISLPWSKAA